MTPFFNEQPQKYIGDGVYATFDGAAVTLDLRGQDATTMIVLESWVLSSLIVFFEQQTKTKWSSADATFV